MAKESEFKISLISDKDKRLISHFISGSWGSSLSVSRGKILDTVNLAGFVCKENDRIIGLVTYHIENNECEIVTLNSVVKNKGLGTKLLNSVLEMAKNNKCKRVWLITTNDNTNAIRFYQKRGFEWIRFYKDAIIESRKLKPEIPEYGDANIPIKHEIEFEYKIE